MPSVRLRTALEAGAENVLRTLPHSGLAPWASRSGARGAVTTGGRTSIAAGAPAMTRAQAFPAVLDLAAAVVYRLEADVRRCIYWLAGGRSPAVPEWREQYDRMRRWRYRLWLGVEH